MIEVHSIHSILLMCLATAAVLFDLSTGRIPNGIIAAGLACGFFQKIFTGGLIGVILWLGGAVLPILLFAWLFYFRMIGAGDVKLWCMAGGFFGPSGCFSCIVWSILLGGLFSFVIMLHRHNISQRITFFLTYVSQYSRDKKWRPYAGGTGEDAKFCFSVPILLGIICQIGGSI